MFDGGWVRVLVWLGFNNEHVMVYDWVMVVCFACEMGMLYEFNSWAFACVIKGWFVNGTISIVNICCMPLKCVFVAVTNTFGLSYGYVLVMWSNNMNILWILCIWAVSYKHGKQFVKEVLKAVPPWSRWHTMAFEGFSVTVASCAFVRVLVWQLNLVHLWGF